LEIEIESTTLYRKSASGGLIVWNIWALDETIHMEYGSYQGAMQHQSEIIHEGLAGRSLHEQIISRIDSRISKKLDLGYVRDREFAMSHNITNSLGLPKPMLAVRFDRMTSDIDLERCYIQYKYDGHRCLIKNIDGKAFAYSRNGKSIETITEILEEFEGLDVPEGAILDGELYAHNVALQTITSYAKRRQPATALLSYIPYDIILNNNFDYGQRLAVLDDLNWANDRIRLAKTFINITTLTKFLDEAIADGYEGLIIRQSGFKYEDGKRSKGLIKVKKFLDDEFPVIDIIESREGWAILVCQTDLGPTFRVSSPGTFEEKVEVMSFKVDYIGRKVNVKFAGWTNANKPFHPIATMWRDKDEE